MHHGEIMVVLIVLIVMGGRLARDRMGIPQRGRRSRDDRYPPPARDANQDGGEAERLRGEVRMLKDRIQVLERIVTDGDRNRANALEQEIESLRDRAAPRRPQEIDR
jgi:hypothetical protein